MSWPSDTLAGLFLFLFAFGLLFGVASLLLGGGGGEADLPGGDPGFDLPDGDADGGGRQGADAAPGNPAIVNASTVLMFLTWFGAAGYIVRAYSGAGAAVSLLVATIPGLIGAALIYLFMAKVLWRGQTRLDPENYHVGGTLARVTAPIRPGGTGEVVYVLDDKQLVAGARGLDGVAIPVGAEVEIVRYEGGLAYVQPRVGAAHGEPFHGQPFEPTSLPPPP